MHDTAADAPVTGTDQPLLETKDLHTWFPIRRGLFAHTVGHVRAVDGVSLRIAPGTTLGLVGESGCGKTTLARTIMLLDPTRSGSILFEGRDLLRLPPPDVRALRRRLQIVFQDPFSSLNPRMTVADLVTEGLVEHAVIHAREREEKALALLAEVGLGSDALHRYPHEFSGGQRQRIAVARAISLRPRLVICDEAVSALDVSVQAQVINLLIELRERLQLAYLFISHDLSVVRHIAHETAVMYLGQIVEQGPTRQVLDRPVHPYTRALVSALPRVGHDKKARILLPGDVPSPAHPPAGCRFHTRCPFVQDACRHTPPVLEPVNGDGAADRLVACLRRNEPLPFS